MYVTVADLDASLRECTARGGTVIGQPRKHQGARFCVIRDPAGAVCALYQPGS
jgi:predicted enzyme related to lactoylglutathione lyase